MNGITILHKPTEDISHINIINEFNTSLFKKHIQRDEKIPVIANPVTAQFEKVSLSVFSETVNNICNLKIKLTKSKNKKITLLSQTSISKYEFCLNSATIFAGSDVKLQYLNGVFNEVVKK